MNDDDDNDNDNDNDDDDDDDIGVIGVCPSIRTETPPGPADGKASGRGKGGEAPPHEGLIPHLYQYQQCTNQ